MPEQSKPDLLLVRAPLDSNESHLSEMQDSISDLPN